MVALMGSAALKVVEKWCLRHFFRREGAVLRPVAFSCRLQPGLPGDPGHSRYFEAAVLGIVAAASIFPTAVLIRENS